MRLAATQVMEVIVEQGIHRVYVTNEAMHPLTVVTLTDILKLLVAECDKAAAMDTS